MADLKVISYEKYDSEGTKAICTICIDEKHVVAYAKKLYEGKEWWTQADHFFKLRNGNKVKIEGYLPESRSMDKQIKDLLNKTEEIHNEVADNATLPF